MIDHLMIVLGFATAVSLMILDLMGILPYAFILGLLFAVIASLHWRSLERKLLEGPGMILTPYALGEEDENE